MHTQSAIPNTSRSGLFRGLRLNTAEGKKVRAIATGLIKRASNPDDPLVRQQAIFAAKAQVKAEEIISEGKSSPAAIAALLQAVDVAVKRVAQL
jgi:hypothetical protein